MEPEQRIVLRCSVVADVTHSLRALSLVGLVVITLCAGGRGAAAAGTVPREALDQAAAAAQSVELAGDQSAARRYIACTLAPLDPRAALDMSGGIRRPSDAARALGSVAAALAKADPARAQQAASTASRLLLRIVEPTRRDQEQRLLLAEIAALGNDAIAAVSEVPAEEARLIVAGTVARSDPTAALHLLNSWKLTGAATDRTLGAIAAGLAASDPEQALKLAGRITSDQLRARILWQIAETRPGVEAAGIAQQVADPLVRSAILSSAAVRMAGETPENAISTARQALVVQSSAEAQLAVACAPSDTERALDLARRLPDRPRRWALERIAVAVAASRPKVAQGLLRDAAAEPQTIGTAVARMATTDPAGAVQFARSLPAGDARDAALGAVAGALAPVDRRQAGDLVWEITNPGARDRAVEVVALQVALADADAATSLIGLVSDPNAALRLRAKVAAKIAPRDPQAALRLLETLPNSDYRRDAAFEAATAMLAAGKSGDDALRVATVAVQRNVALRWLLPALVVSQAGSPIRLSDSISDAYLRSLALADVARRLARMEPSPKPSPPLAHMIRPVAEWEGI